MPVTASTAMSMAHPSPFIKHLGTIMAGKSGKDCDVINADDILKTDQV